MDIQIQRRILEKTYDALCTISQSVTKKVNGETVIEDEVVLTHQPCALSQGSSKYAHQTETKADVSYVAKLFIAPEIKILPGSKIIVEQYGATYQLKQTGLPIKYPTHQEIMLIQEGVA